MSRIFRHTNLASLLDILSQKRLTLLNPATWDDRNDAYFLSEYKNYLNAKSVLALCLTEASETYHHWRVFCSSSDGVRIEFDKDLLLSNFKDDTRVMMRSVLYSTLKNVKSLEGLSAEDLPFLKRHAFRDEKEFRLVVIDKVADKQTEVFPIDLECIKRVTFSPWLHSDLTNTIKGVVRNIEGCKDIKLARSTLVNNKDLQQLASRLARKKT